VVRQREEEVQWQPVECRSREEEVMVEVVVAVAWSPIRNAY
jgi:hypothetical protein